MSSVTRVRERVTKILQIDAENPIARKRKSCILDHMEVSSPGGAVKMCARYRPQSRSSCGAVAEQLHSKGRG